MKKSRETEIIRFIDSVSSQHHQLPSFLPLLSNIPSPKAHPQQRACPQDHTPVLKTSHRAMSSAREGISASCSLRAFPKVPKMSPHDSSANVSHIHIQTWQEKREHHGFIKEHKLLEKTCGLFWPGKRGNGCGNVNHNICSISPCSYSYRSPPFQCLCLCS